MLAFVTLFYLFCTNQHKFNELSSIIQDYNNPNMTTLVRTIVKENEYVVKVIPSENYDKYSFIMNNFKYPDSIPTFESIIKTYFTNQERIYLYGPQDQNYQFISQANGKLTITNYPMDPSIDDYIIITWTGSSTFIDLSRRYPWKLKYDASPPNLSTDEQTTQIKITTLEDALRD